MASKTSTPNSPERPQKPVIVPYWLWTSEEYLEALEEDQADRRQSNR
jgi:hypothetical protein